MWYACANSERTRGAIRCCRDMPSIHSTILTQVATRHWTYAHGLLAVSVIAGLLAQPALGQSFLLGVKGGTPLSDASATTAVGSFRFLPSSGTSVLDVRRYTIGPAVEFALPLRLRVQADFLYKRLDRTENLSFVGLRRTIRREKANSWEFPLALKYVWELGTAKPFVLAGGSIRWINSFEGSLETFELVPNALEPYSLREYRIDDALAEGGWVLGSGMRFDVGILKISPEIRYTRWTSERFLPTRNQMEFLLGVMF